MRKTVFSDNIIMSMTFQKAKSCPHPAEKQKWYHTTLRKPKPRYVSAIKKEISAAPVHNDPESQKSLKLRLFQPRVMYFLSVKLEFIGLFTILSKIEIPDQSNLFWLHCIQQAISFLLEMLSSRIPAGLCRASDLHKGR